MSINIENMSAEDEIMNLIENGKNISMLSQGGTGKSTLVKKIKKKLDSDYKFEVTSTTGVSAYLIGGVTIHSFSGIGVLKINKDIIKKVKKNKYAKKRITECDILVIDEISMLGATYFDMLNHVFKEIRNNKKPFGGMIVIITGDFLQIPPINDKYAFESKTWKELNLHPIHLDKVYRYTDEKYSGILSRIRLAKHTSEDNVELFKRLKAYNNIEEYDIFDIQPTFLSSKINEVFEKNRDELSKNPNELVIYSSIDTEYNTSFLDFIAPKIIELKLGAQVMLNINIDVEKGLTNGSRGVVVNLSKDIVSVKFMNGMIFNIERHDFIYEEDDKILATRKQFPLQLAYCLTIHKCQGSTLDCAIIDIGYSVFEKHMVYVALSRVRCLDGLYLKAFQPSKIKVDQKVMNFLNL